MSEEIVWYKLVLLSEDAEKDSVYLFHLGAAGVEVQDHQTFMEDGSIMAVPEGQARLIAFFDSETALPMIEDWHPNGFQWARFDDKSWETAWMKWFHPVEISERVVIGPPWETFAPRADDGVAIVIEPGMAFGTGTHETTQLVAAIIDEYYRDHFGTSLLDVGCGSGVLSMIARRLGAGRVMGIDHDPVAIEVARACLRRNDLEGEIELGTAPLSSVDSGWGLVVANILAHILLTLKEDLIRVTAPGGTLVLSGITTEDAPTFQQSFAASELDLLEVRQKGDWVAMVWKRK